MTVCAICGETLGFAYPCSKIHEHHCHDCYTRSLQGGYDSQPHAAPREVPVLTPREHQAVAAYQRRVLALVHPTDLARVVTEEGPHG